MASTQQLKSRIRSVKSTKQITKAMQMVAASKMRRAQDATKASQPYERAANELLTYFASIGATDDHRWFLHRDIKSRLIIVIASDKGLAGAYNTNVLKAYLTNLRSDDTNGISGGMFGRLIVSREYRRLFAPSYVCGAGVLVLGIVLLAVDLGRADRLLLLVTQPHATHLVIGAYALFFCVVLAVA